MNDWAHDIHCGASSSGIQRGGGIIMGCERGTELDRCGDCCGWPGESSFIDRRCKRLLVVSMMVVVVVDVGDGGTLLTTFASLAVLFRMSFTLEWLRSRTEFVHLLSKY